MALRVYVREAMLGSIALTAFARLVVAHGAVPPVLDSDDAVLFVRTTGSCPTDAGVDAPPDGGSDAGVLPDAGVPPDAGTVPTLCGDAVMMVVQPKFQIDTGGSRFALLYVTPGPPATRLESSTTFDDLATQTAPAIREVEVDVPDPALGTRCAGCMASSGTHEHTTGGCGGGAENWSAPALDGGVDPVTLETVGPYEVAHIHAASRSEVAAWLDSLDYDYLPTDLDAVEPYLALGWTVVAVRVSSTHAVDGALEPLSMTWAGSEIRVPLGLSHQPTPQITSLTVYIAASHEMDLSSAYLSFSGRIGNSGAGFVTRNEITYDHSAPADADPIASVAPNDQDFRDEIVNTTEVHVPVEHNCNDDGCLCSSNRAGPSANAPWYLGAILLVLRRRSPRSKPRVQR